METIDLGEKSTKIPFWGLNERKTPLIIQFIEIGRGDYVRQQCKHSLKLYRKKKQNTGCFWKLPLSWIDFAAKCHQRQWQSATNNPHLKHLPNWSIFFGARHAICSFSPRNNIITSKRHTQTQMRWYKLCYCYRSSNLESEKKPNNCKKNHLKDDIHFLG